MRIAVLIVYLFTLLVGGSYDVHAGTPGSGGHEVQLLLNKTPQVQATHTPVSYVAATGVDVSTEDDYLIGDDIEEEDWSSSFAGKYRLLARSYLALFSLFFVSSLYKRFKALPPFHGQPAPIYITQRVLRI